MAMVLDAFVSEFVKMLVSYSNERIAMIFGVSEEIKKLGRKLALIQNVLADAERRQLQEDAAVKQWLDELQDIVYDAEDIMEEYKAEAENFIEEGSDSSSLGVRCCSSLKLFRQVKSKNDIAEKIKNLNRRLDDINKEKEAFRFEKTRAKESKQRRISQTTSPLVEPDIVGSAIEDATRNMVGLLTQENNKKNILIYAIVGMGGIGKTTLAQKICNDDILLTSFHPVKPVWVCVSKDNFDEINILKSIIRVLGGDSNNVNERGELEHMLNEVVRGKRLFLVLDDVWDAQVWKNLLRKPLCTAEIGSRVLLTTREDHVAMQIGAEHRHNVAKLSDEDGWLLLCKKVFSDGQVEEMNELKETGIQIVKKCDGLPIAINTVAGVLQTKELTNFEWEKVLLDPSWSLKSVEQVFKLSYEDLPSHLKQCFLYFSLFPEDFYFERDEITSLWIVEGFVKTKDNKMLEETANDYWKELIQRNLLQVIYPRTLICKMHDLLRKFTEDLVRGESCCGGVQALNEIVSKTQRRTRRWYVHDVSDFRFHAINENLHLLRTVITYRDLTDKVSIETLDNSFRLLKRTRILKLCNLKLEKLPSSFTYLKYLRYLDLSYSGITELPESIKSFRNLQFLSLYDCSYLQSLPNAIGFFTNMRYLNVSGTKIDRMPKEMVKLRQLRTLRGFAISGSSSDGGRWCTLEDVKYFKELKELELYNLERTSGAAEARAASLADKTHLTRLQLNYYKHEETCDEETDAYEELCPPICIEELHIRGYYGRTFPSWLKMPSSMMNLKTLTLDDCPHCEKLPPLEQLPQLIELYISRMWFRRVALDVFLRNTKDAPQRPFPKLENLCFRSLYNWEEWEDWADEKEDQNLQKKILLFPRLKILQIFECPKLRYLPHLLLDHATALTELSIFRADELEAVENLHHIKTLKIYSCGNLKRVTNLSSLKTLDISYCGNLLESLPELQLLTISGANMESLPALEHLPNLHKLSISRGKISLLLGCIMGGEEWPKIRDIPQFEFHSYGLFIKYTRSPFSYNTNIYSIKFEDEDLPEQVNNSSLHQHPLALLPSIDYCCSKCGGEGKGWFFSCEDCFFDLHPKCALQES